MYTRDRDQSADYERRYGRHEGAQRAQPTGRRAVPTLDWSDEDDEDMIEVRGIALQVVKMWVGPEGSGPTP